MANLPPCKNFDTRQLHPPPPLAPHRPGEDERAPDPLIQITTAGYEMGKTKQCRDIATQHAQAKERVLVITESRSDDDFPDAKRIGDEDYSKALVVVTRYGNLLDLAGYHSGFFPVVIIDGVQDVLAEMTRFSDEPRVRNNACSALAQYLRVCGRLVIMGNHESAHERNKVDTFITGVMRCFTHPKLERHEYTHHQLTRDFKLATDAPEWGRSLLYQLVRGKKVALFCANEEAARKTFRWFAPDDPTTQCVSPRQCQLLLTQEEGGRLLRADTTELRFLVFTGATLPCFRIADPWDCLYMDVRNSPTTVVARSVMKAASLFKALTETDVPVLADRCPRLSEAERALLHEAVVARTAETDDAFARLSDSFTLAHDDQALVQRITARNRKARAALPRHSVGPVECSEPRPITSFWHPQFQPEYLLSLADANDYDHEVDLASDICRHALLHGFGYGSQVK